MGFPCRGVLAEAGSGGADRPCDGQRDERGEQVQLGRVGQAGILKIQAARFGIAEQRLDGLSLPVGGQRVVAGAVGGDDDPVTIPGLEGGEVQGPGHAVERGGAAPATRV